MDKQLDDWAIRLVRLVLSVGYDRAARREYRKLREHSASVWNNPDLPYTQSATHAVRREIDLPLRRRKSLLTAPPGWFENVQRAYEDEQNE